MIYNLKSQRWKYIYIYIHVYICNLLHLKFWKALFLKLGSYKNINDIIVKRIKRLFKWYVSWPLLLFKIFEGVVTLLSGLAQTGWLYNKYLSFQKQNWPVKTFFENVTKFYNNPDGHLLSMGHSIYICMCK